jgi:hypothetical protein
VRPYSRWWSATYRNTAPGFLTFGPSACSNADTSCVGQSQPRYAVSQRALKKETIQQAINQAGVAPAAAPVSEIAQCLGAVDEATREAIREAVADALAGRRPRW